MAGFLYGESVVRHRGRPKLDPYSGEQSGVEFSPLDDESFDGWGVDDSRSVSPSEVGRDAVVTDFVLYRAEPADVLPGDEITVRGLRCQVVGRPAFWVNPFTGLRAGFVVRADVKEG